MLTDPYKKPSLTLFSNHSHWHLLRIFILGVLIPFLLTLLNFGSVARAQPVIKVGVYQFAPLIFIDEDGQEKGIFIDILDEVSKRKDWQIEYVSGTWAEHLENLKSADLDLLPVIVPTEERKKIYDFTNESILSSWGQVYVRPGFEVQNILDLNGSKLAVQKGDYYYGEFIGLSSRFGLAAQFVEVAESRDIFELIDQGKVDGGIIERLHGLELEKRYHAIKSPTIFDPKPLLFAVPNGKNRFLIEALDSYLLESKKNKNSVYFKSLKKWLDADSEWVLPSWVHWSLIVGGSLLTVFFLFGLASRLQIRKKTAELLEANTRLHQEIAERIQAERANIDLKEFYQHILEKVEEGIWVTDENDVMIFFNPGMEKIAGVIAAEAVGMSVTKDFPKETIEHFLKFYQTAKNTLQPQRYEAEVVTPAGRATIQEGWLVPRVKESRYHGMICTIQDISERKKAETALRESEAKFRVLTETAPIGIYMTDPEGDYVYTNTNWQKQAGLTFEEALGVGWKDGLHPDDREKVFKDWMKTVESGDSWRTEYRFQNRDKKTIWLYATATAIKKDNGDLTGYIGVNTDITLQKQAANQIEASLNEKETLLQEIHHRVKNNMQIIASLLSLQLHRQENRQVNEILKENISRVHAMAVIHESFYHSENLSQIDLHSYLTRLTQMLIQTYSPSQSRISFKIDAKGLNLNIDKANPLGLVLNELISNSLKYAFPSNQEGSISIRSAVFNGNEVELIVSDSGSGMPDGFNWEAIQTLGLRLVKDIVERQLNGAIKLDNQNGTRYTIRFNLES